jgi:hypothetical protein
MLHKAEDGRVLVREKVCCVANAVLQGPSAGCTANECERTRCGARSRCNNAAVHCTNRIASNIHHTNHHATRRTPKLSATLKACCGAALLQQQQQPLRIARLSSVQAAPGPPTTTMPNMQHKHTTTQPSAHLQACCGTALLPQQQQSLRNPRLLLHQLHRVTLQLLRHTCNSNTNTTQHSPLHTYRCALAQRTARL